MMKKKGLQGPVAKYGSSLLHGMGLVSPSGGIDPDALPLVSGPNNQFVIEGLTATFTVSSPNTDTYQWQHDQGTGTWIDIIAETTNSYSRTTDGTQDGWSYRCVCTNINGSTTSAEGLLTIVVTAPIADAFFNVPDIIAGSTYSYDASQNFTAGGAVDTYIFVDNLGNPYGSAPVTFQGVSVTFQGNSVTF